MPLTTLPLSRQAATAACCALLALAGCGGGSNPLGNPPVVENPGNTTGQQRLSFVYFQKCINPIFIAQLPITVNGATTTNTCAGSGCHSDATGTGGAFRVVPGAQLVDLSDPANTADVIRTTDMYRNFYSAQGEVVLGSTTQSRLLAKPLLLNVLHGGGLIFESEQDANVKLIQYWISHPVPLGQDEFSSAANSMFTPADPATGTCNTQ
jgi:predicted CxxxxCH...CXXCH cytochrome family protein